MEGYISRVKPLLDLKEETAKVGEKYSIVSSIVSSIDNVVIYAGC